MNVTDLITDRMHENLNHRDIDTVERYRWLIEMIAVEYAAHKVKNIGVLADVSEHIHDWHLYSGTIDGKIVILKCHKCKEKKKYNAC